VIGGVVYYEHALVCVGEVNQWCGGVI